MRVHLRVGMAPRARKGRDLPILSPLVTCKLTLHQDLPQNRTVLKTMFTASRTLFDEELAGARLCRAAICGFKSIE